MADARLFRQKFTKFLQGAPLTTPAGEVLDERINVQFGWRGGNHEPTKCWEYRRTGTNLRMFFAYYDSFSPDDLICLVLGVNETPRLPTAGATIQYNSDNCVSGAEFSHPGLITARKRRSRQELLDEILRHAPHAALQLRLNSTSDWPIVLGTTKDFAALLDSVFLYTYAVEQAKRSFRGTPLLPAWARGKQPARLNSQEQLAADIREIKGRNDICETQKTQLIRARRGQGKFRKHVCAMWGSKCAVVGCGLAELLRASHIKPWRESTDQERLDPYNGLLLTPNLDAAFDAMLISFDDDGGIVFSPNLPKVEARRLGLSETMQIAGLTKEHRKYLKHHRDECRKS